MIAGDLEEEKRYRLAQLESSIPDMSNFSPEMRDAVIGSYLSQYGYGRTKEQVNRSFKEATALYKIMHNPRPCHLNYLQSLISANLDDPKLVRKTILDRIDWNKRMSPFRHVVFGHLWKGIAKSLNTSIGLNWYQAYPDLIPRV